MNLFELRALCEGGDALERMRDRPEWSKYDTWNDLIAMAVKSRQQSQQETQRRLFSAELPDDLVRHVLAASPLRFHLTGARLSSSPVAGSDEELGALDVYVRYGGAVLTHLHAQGAHELDAKALRRGAARRDAVESGDRPSVWRRLHRRG